MKNLVILICVIFSISLFGQKWCAPGAQWNYTFSTPFWDVGFVTISYTLDTIINTLPCKKLKKEFHGYNYFSHTFYNTIIGNEYTYENSGIVYVLFNGVFDTLYNFSAKIGDQWGFPKKTLNISYCDSNSRFHVIDTGTIIFNSVPIKYLVVNSPEAFNYQDTIFEKIGLINGYMFPFDRCDGAADGNEGGPLRCYSDNNFPIFKPFGYTLDCDYISTGIKENEPKINISPNPFCDKFSITIFGLDIDNYMEIYNFSGKMVLHCKLTSERNLINMRDFESGLYIMKIYDQNHLLIKKMAKL